MNEDKYHAYGHVRHGGGGGGDHDRDRDRGRGWHDLPFYLHH